MKQFYIKRQAKYTQQGLTVLPVLEVLQSFTNEGKVVLPVMIKINFY